MAVTVYRAYGSATRPENIVQPVEVGKLTPRMVFLLNGRRVSRISDWESYHETFEAAVDHLISMAQGRIRDLEEQIEYKKAQIERIESLLKNRGD